MVEAENAWRAYLGYLTMKGEATDVVESAAIIGLNGALWAQSDNFSLTEYDLEIQIDEENKEVAKINELAAMVEFLTKGKVEALGGLRISNEKYMMIDKDLPMYQLSKKNGGGCIYVCKTCAVFAGYDKDKMSSDRKFQSQGTTAMQVEKLGVMLKDGGY